MCVILVGKVSKDLFVSAKTQNPDGFSVFTKETGLVKAPGQDVVNKALDTFGVWHFRISTSGVKDASNIHPFPVCKGEWLLYHNGILGDGKGALSDTAALAETLMEVPYATARAVLGSLATNNRFLLVKANDPTTFVTIGQWTCDGGVLMSHKMYTFKSVTSVAGGYSWSRDDIHNEMEKLQSQVPALGSHKMSKKEKKAMKKYKGFHFNPCGVLEKGGYYDD